MNFYILNLFFSIKKIILIELVRKKFFKNLITKKFPSHVIRVRKRDILEFQKIVCNYDAIEVNLTSESIDLCNIWEICKITFIFYTFVYLK